ncbi:MAG: GntR family transcriptional regulator [Gemmiger sp.]|nr:GntR family transcriptional regulator [Gemmiger sp.]
MLLEERKPGEAGRDYALRMLRKNIVNLELAPGAKVSESVLAQELGLSRTPVREALVELAKAKIVEVYPQRGCTIAKICFERIREAQFMREALDRAVAERCCALDMAPYRAALQENLAQQAHYWQHLDVEKMFALDNDFHRQLYLAADAAQVFALLSSMTIHYDRVRAVSITAVKKLRIAEEHTEILNAILAKDKPAAAAAVHAHLARYASEQAEMQAHYPQYFG